MTLRRDYSYKRFHNPLFKNRPAHRRALFSLGRLTAATVILALCGAVWLFAFSPFFQIDQINVSGSQHIAAWEYRAAVNDVLNQKRWFIFPKRSLLILSEDDLIKQLNDRFVLASAEVVKRPPRTLDLTIKERISSIRLKMPDGSQAILDLDGIVIRLYRPDEVLDPEAQALNLLVIDKQEALALKTRIVDPAVIQAVIDAPKALDDAFGGTFKISELHLDNKSSRTLRIVTSEGWAIYTDAQQPMRGQLANARLVVQNKVGGDRSKLDYVDVRFNEKVFFKLK